MSTDTTHTFCRICEALCGLEMTVEDGQVTAIKPDPRHVATRGFACVKGLKQHKIYSSKDRVLYPQKRVGSDWRRISWEQAFEEIGQKLRRLRGISPDSIAMYVGTAAGFGVLHPVFAQGFMQGIGSRNMYSSATQDCANKFAVATQVYGFPFTQPFPDVNQTNCLIVVGANPAISKWSFLQVSNPIERMRAIAERGKLYFVDPRKTESAKVAGEHVFIRPNTDVFFYLAFLNELIATGGVDEARVREHMSDFEAVKQLVEPWTPERVASVTRMDAAKLREMVKAYREADGAALYLSTGVNMGTNGSLAFWLQEVINAVSGNLDKNGGTLVGKGILDFAKLGEKTGAMVSKHNSRIGGFATVNDTFPGGIMADEILTPGDQQIRALFVTGGNPLLTMANGARLREAFEKLELLVCLDIFRSDTASLAHYILPSTTPLERPDLPFLFPLLMGMQSRPYLQATEPVIAPPGEVRDEASIYLSLARAAGTGLWGSKPFQLVMEAARWAHSRRHPGEQPSIPQRALLDLILRLTGNGSFKELLRFPHGRPRPPHEGDTFLSKRIITEDRKVHLAPPVLMKQAEKLEGDFLEEKANAGRLKLITRRAVTTHNSWTHNLEDFVEGDRGTNYLYVHPQDGARLGLSEGALAEVRSQTASVRIPVRYLAELMPGTVAMPHGWGHQASQGLSVASQTRGVNVNLLAADGPDRLEKVSGMAHLTGVLVDVVPVEERDEASWSGMPAVLG